MKKIRINSSLPYDVHVGRGILKNSGKIFSEVGIEGKLAIVSDTNVAPLYLKALEDSLLSSGYEVFHFTVNSGEKWKNMTTLSDILEFFADSGLTRADTAVALGGGVVGDLTGFAAGCYMRGISYVQIPTTLLSCVDSSVGGKTGVDLKGGKNLAGLFIQPKIVICDVDCLNTLSDEIYSEGMAEVIKTAILSSEELFTVLEGAQRGRSEEDIVSACVEYKGEIVSKDEFEKGERKLLNLGHTPAHAIELLSNYEISHGAAVGMGLSIMTAYAEKSKKITSKTADRIFRLLESYSLGTKIDISPSDLAKAALSDKKRVGNSIDVININRIGSCSVDRIPTEKLSEIFEMGIKNEN